MKVLSVIGSPHSKGCVYTALSQVGEALKAEGVDSDVYWIGSRPIQGCIGCMKCVESGRCVFDDKVNEFTHLAQDYDGFLFGTPVYYAGMNGSLMSFMDRVFFSASRQTPHPFRLKPAAAVATARRAGSTGTIDQINKYFLHQQMPIISSRYWNMAFGNTPDEILQDREGMQILRVLGKNMAWFLKLKEAGEKAGISIPEQESVRVGMNFIR